jgi:hypothetical protein
LMVGVGVGVRVEDEGGDGGEGEGRGRGARARGEGEGTPLQIELDVDDLHEVLHRVVLEVEAVPGNGGTQGSRWARTAEWWEGGVSLT